VLDVIPIAGHEPGSIAVRTTFQPDEHGLALGSSHILELAEAVPAMKDAPIRQIHNDFIVYPR